MPRSAAVSFALFLPLLLNFVASPAEGATLGPRVVNPANGQRYYLLNSATWNSSENEAIALGGHLATVNDQAEEDWIFNAFASYGGQSRLLWIGLNDVAVEGKFVWANAEPVQFTAWGPGEPNSIDSEDFVAIFYPGHSVQNRWNDWGSRSSDPIGLPFNGVVEINPGTVLTPLIAAGSVWKFRDNGADLGPAWRTPGFDDTAWASGAAQLGYGDGDEATVVSFGNVPTNKHITTYFRQSFLVPNPSAFARLNVRLLRDDGAVLYLNGIEVYRSNMPEGTIGYRTLASAAAAGADETEAFHTRAISAGLLQAGSNVLAVEVHQSATDSSDLSFDLELNGMNNLPPNVLLCEPAGSEIIAAPGPLRIIANAADDDRVVRVEFFADSFLVGVATNTPFARVWSNAPAGCFDLRAVAIDSIGLGATSAPVRVCLHPGLVPRGSVWRYFDLGVDLGTSWRLPEYDDDSWSTGPAQLGYGDGDEASVIGFGTNAASKHITTYFRRQFTVADAGTFTNLILRLLRDDGAAVYLNGAEVMRDNLPAAGSILFSTLALTALGGADEMIFIPINLPPHLLRTGTNTLAVEAHQATANSSDLSFDLELVGQLPSLEPTLIAEREAGQIRLTWPAWAAGHRLLAADNLAPPASWQEVLMPTPAMEGAMVRISLPANSSSRFFRLIAP